ncbi:hypothetical protein ACH3VR_03560 [Microbacterium sp. B2969]|uniref:Trypsin-like peptidase domain-containing protein n=1 Tax=Microbacterium alkaliflavum TaxID=3248839 RepID=A0ABW7Q3M5_9MICO
MADELDPRQVLELRERARDRLIPIPGVLAVGFGRKQVGEQLTDRRALRVYVEEKKPLDQVAAGEVIPAEIEGVPTDVLPIPRGRAFGTQDTQRHSPLLGGITITNLKLDAAGTFGAGTLGCFATIDGQAPRENIVLLTNNHVLATNGGQLDDTVYQPPLVGGLIDKANAGAIAKVHSLGVNGTHGYTYPGEKPVDYYVDCATAKLAIDISSWCDCNCGVSYKNALRDLTVGGRIWLEGVARAVDGETVYKSGCTTGGTRGTIADPLGSAMIGTPAVQVDNIILIDRTNPPDPLFAAEGDSGSALVNDQSRLIGLVFGGQDATEPNPQAFACHIAPALDALKVTPISTQNPPVAPAGKASTATFAPAAATLADEEDQTLRLQERARETAEGRRLYGDFLQHRSEIVALVNRRRRVTIAWHRVRGPAYFAHFAESARHPEHRIPSEIDGVSRRELLERMADALTAEGSEPLRAAITRHRDELMALVDRFDDLHSLVDGFGEHPATA